MSHIQFLVAAGVLVFSTSLFAAPTAGPLGKLRGDWNEKLALPDTPPPYFPSYKYEYNCQVEVFGEPIWDNPTVAVANFTINNQSTGFIDTSNLPWRSYQLNGDQSLTLLNRAASSLFDSATKIWVESNIVADLEGEDQFELTLYLKMAVTDDYWITDTKTSSTDRMLSIVKTAKAHVEAEAARPGKSDLSRTAQVICKKIK